MKVGVNWHHERAAGAGPQGRVVLIDPRGMGKTSPKAESGGNPSPFGRDVRVDGYIALYIGRPPLGSVPRHRPPERMLEVARCRDEREGAPRVSSGGSRRGRSGSCCTRPLLDEHWADQTGHARAARLLIFPWADVVERGVSRDQMGNVVPGVLKAYDLPDLAAMAGSHFSAGDPAPVDAMGEPVSQADARAVAMHNCGRAYGPGGELVLQARANDQKM